MSTRRTWLRQTALATTAWLAAPRLLMAHADTPRRLVFVLQRGAADGLHTVVPYADPGYARLRGALAIDPAEAIRLDGSFALHPALQQIGHLHSAGQALFVHAVASPYRERSHFDGQNVLETGGSAPRQLRDGWLNRLLGLLPRHGQEAVALAPMVPPALRGSHAVASYAPSALQPPADDLLLRVGQLYAGDAALAPLWGTAMQARDIASATDMAGGRARRDAAALGRLAAGFLSRADGPRIAMVETDGWDTHQGQAGRMATQLRALDALVAALRDGLGPAWQQTAVLVATEFGRTAAVNGTGGTDHGTASAALLLGGAVRGGRVLTDWPGLAPAALHEGRDLRPTLALDALFAATAAECFGLDTERVTQTLFPGQRGRLPGGPLLRG